MSGVGCHSSLLLTFPWSQAAEEQAKAKAQAKAREVRFIYVFVLSTMLLELGCFALQKIPALKQEEGPNFCTSGSTLHFCRIMQGYQFELLLADVTLPVQRLVPRDAV